MARPGAAVAERPQSRWVRAKVTPCSSSAVVGPVWSAPASTRSTRRLASSVRRAASVHPAEPPPMMTTSNPCAAIAAALPGGPLGVDQVVGLEIGEVLLPHRGELVPRHQEGD